MNSLEISIPFVVAIIGLAYPILLQVISRLDEKYGAEISSLFKEENEYKWFYRSLICVLIILLLYIIFKIFCILFIPEGWEYGLNSSFKLIIIFSTTILVALFIILTKKILVYYSTIELAKYLIDKDKISRNINNYEYIKPLSRIFYFSIRNQNEEITKTISKYIYTCFNSFRKVHPNNIEGYPEVYYELVYRTAQEIILIKDNKIKEIEDRVFGGIWLFGEFEDNKIAERTYTYMWHILSLAVKSNREDLIMSFWKNSFQYFTYSLREIDEEYSEDYSTILNQSEIDKRNFEIERYLEFHFALGGLLTYQNKSELILRIFRFTNSEPPKYVLLPESMTEVFQWFMHFRDYYERKIPFISNRYPYPNIEGVDAGGFIRNWICKYISILFLRQYTLRPNYYKKTVDIPGLPESKDDRLFWLQNIDYFKSLVSNILEDKDLLKDIGFDIYDYFSDKWCIKNKIIEPLKLIANTKKMLNKSVEETDINQIPEEEKIIEFKSKTKSIINKTIEEYKPIFNKYTIEVNFRKWYPFPASKTILDKAAFCERQGIDYSNFHSILAEYVSSNFKLCISETFYSNIRKSYLLKDEDLFAALGRLKVNKDKYVLVSFRLEHLKTGISSAGYEFINYDECNYPLVGRSLFILKNEDLPFIKYNDIYDEDKRKYNADKIDDKINLYASIIDLNKNEDIRKENEQANSGKDLRKYVLAYINFPVEIRWKNDVNLIQIILQSPYEQKGLPNKVEDIEPIE